MRLLSLSVSLGPSGYLESFLIGFHYMVLCNISFTVFNFLSLETFVFHISLNIIYFHKDTRILNGRLWNVWSFLTLLYQFHSFRVFETIISYHMDHSNKKSLFPLCFWKSLLCTFQVVVIYTESFFLTMSLKKFNFIFLWFVVIFRIFSYRQFPFPFIYLLCLIKLWYYHHPFSENQYRILDYIFS